MIDNREMERQEAKKAACEIIDATIDNDEMALTFIHRIVLDSENDSINIQGFTASSELSLKDSIMAGGLLMKKYVDDLHNSVLDGSIPKEELWKLLIGMIQGIAKKY